MPKGRGGRPERPLARRGPRREPKLKLTIFCEGMRTEPDYIDHFRRLHGNNLVEIEMVAGAGVPATLVEKAAEAVPRRRKKDSLARNDQVWVVFDRDEHPNVAEARAQAARFGVMVAFSNPCFEVWALLHLQDHDAPIGRHDVIGLLREHFPDYDRGKPKSFDCERLGSHFDDAVARARAMRARREADESDCPYTDVDVLMLLIRENGKR